MEKSDTRMGEPNALWGKKIEGGNDMSRCLSRLLSQEETELPNQEHISNSSRIYHLEVFERL